MHTRCRAQLQSLFRAAIGAADPAGCMAAHLPPAPRGRTLVVGAGKAAASMAAAVEAAWDRPLEGLVVTRYGHGMATRQIEVVEASHPVPDAEGPRAAQRILDRMHGLTADDLVLFLISGGASSLLALPALGLTLAHKQSVNRALLRSGAQIGEMNCVRKHLSAIKGGRLAAAASPAQRVSLVISDVPGDDLSVIGSGPTVADATTRLDALAILRTYGIDAPAPVWKHLESEACETPKPGDPRLAGVENILIATPQMALEAAADAAAAMGYHPLILGNGLEGEAREVGIVHAGIARQCAAHGQPARLPAAILSGGETTVTVRGEGRGGRNAEFLLSLAIALDGAPGICAMAGDTDGIDGSQDNAGALLFPDTLARAAALGIDVKAALAGNDAYSVFAALGDLVMTGPTRTNVNDFRVMLIDRVG